LPPEASLTIVDVGTGQIDVHREPHLERYEVIRPFGRGETFKEWIAPNIAINKSGPPSDAATKRARTQ
jgi:hypothetical protein